MATQEKLGKPREVILGVATRLFSEAGYAGTTMREIANAVGVLPGSLYAHIDGKETLLFEIVEGGIDNFLDATADLGEIKDPAERTRAAVKAHLGVVAESPERTLVVFHQWRYLKGPSRARVLDKRKRYEDVFVKIMDEGISSGTFSARLDPKIAVLSILGSLNWAAEWFHPDGPEGPEQVGERLADTILWGLLRD
jgi:TetR/AcrR family transcriptional regulator, cholesterol catabolism regulator